MCISQHISKIVDQTPKEVWGFFCIFSRFDYALKRSGFMIHNRDRRADISWPSADYNGFSIALGEDFFENIKNSHDASILFNAPPLRQIICNDQPTWPPRENAASPDNCKKLFESIKHIRNNLFHGEKCFNYRSDEAQGRDLKLIKAAIFVLLSALDKCKDNESPDKLKCVANAFAYF